MAELLATLALILALGVAARVLADRLRIPSVLFLIAAGVVLGPLGLGLVDEDTFGSGLEPLVGASVAIILFDGAFQLRVDDIKRAPKAIATLVTVGALIMWVGTTGVVYLLLTERIEVAMVIGALLIATGPTVITPILNVVPVRDHVGATLEAEGIINDVTAAVLAVVLFEVLLVEEGTFFAVGTQLVGRLLLGLAAGLVVAGALYWLLDTVDRDPDHASLHAKLIVFASVLVAFGGAELIAGETGIAAAATLGFVFGNTDVAHRDEVESFMEDLTVIVLSFIFVALAALIQFDDIVQLGAAGLVVAFVIVAVIRPLLIFISVRADRFTRNERLFMSFVGPRGIIVAAVATLFAVRLQTEVPDGEAVASVLTGTVFLVIFVTVVFQGGPARKIAQRLDVIPMHTIIVGAGRVGTELARRLEQDGENVTLVEQDETAAQEARDLGLSVVEGNGTDATTLERAGINNAKTVIAATPDDETNMLLCQTVNTNYEVDRVVSRVHDPEKVSAFEQMGIDAISESMATAYSIENTIERPGISSWMNELGRTGDVQEVEVTAKNLAGKTVAEIRDEIPDGCLLALVIHEDGRTMAPDGSTELYAGDQVTFIGEREAVREAVIRFHPEG